jgi:hypothetical protein
MDGWIAEAGRVFDGDDLDDNDRNGELKTGT